ncbi:PKD domain-containing protein [Flavisolibacter nicotianae]|uniref:PKD domain-containing protein n=1 Tax=Flavisolibacter nicotianae TaxID=2364882 RepID=UPI000EB233A1|nr:PKD domain-containing protein [Flavisolibacter nicotianae]
MRKTLLLLAAACCGLLLSAQTVPSVNFGFTIDAATSNANFTNQSRNLGDGVKKAYWSFGDGNRAVTGAADGTHHQYARAASYEVCLKIYRYPTNSHDSVLVGSACRSLTIQQVCTAAFQWVDSMEGAKPTRFIKFYGYGQSNAGRVLEVCWKFGDGTDSCRTFTNSSIPDRYLLMMHRYQESGVYTACLRVKFDGGCVAEKCSTVTVPKIEADKDSCRAEMAVQSITATPLGRRFVAKPWSSLHKKPLRVCWTFGDGKDTCVEYTSTYTGDYWVEHRYAQNGRYEACVSIRYDGGCESRSCQAFTIEQPAPPPTSCEAGLNEVATNLASLERKFYVGLQANRRAEKICWKFGDGTDSCVVLSNPVNPQQLLVAHRYAAPGKYTVCIRVQYAEGCVAERCRPVEIRVPHNNICGGYMTDSLGDGNVIRFTATSIHGPNDEATGYLWSFGDGTSASGKEVKHAFGTPGTYTVCVSIKTREGCETKICKPITVAGNAQPQLTLAPNPVVNNLTAVFRSLVQQTVSVRIYNGTGVLIRSYTRSAVVGANTWTFELGSLQTGVYSMVVQSANQFATAIFFKQ